jgi:hypothetical protein
MYRVIEYFEDLQDNGQPYNVGDVFPKGDKKVTEERLNELATDKNRRRIPLIKKVEEPKVEKPSKKATKKAVKETE